MSDLENTLRDEKRTLVMGILNVTPDSFSDGGLYVDRAAAVERALRMLDDGADIIDIGGESTRPGAPAVDLATEIERTAPVVDALLTERPDTWVSIDTTKAPVARAALAAGARMVNDISGLGFDREIGRVAAEFQAWLVLMHIQGNPQTMQDAPRYDDVVDEVKKILAQRVELAVSLGVARDRILVDPGIGFGKTLEHNLELLARLSEFQSLGRPLLIGTSRKSFIGTLTGRAPTERGFGTAATVACAVAAGARIVRVHDVAQMVDVVRVSDAIRSAAR